jgi:hypothetical protein
MFKTSRTKNTGNFVNAFGFFDRTGLAPKLLRLIPVEQLLLDNKKPNAPLAVDKEAKNAGS